MPCSAESVEAMKAVRHQHQEHTQDAWSKYLKKHMQQYQTNWSPWVNQRYLIPAARTTVPPLSTPSKNSWALCTSKAELEVPEGFLAPFPLAFSASKDSSCRFFVCSVPTS